MLSRHYGTGGYYTAPGWVFSFDRRLSPLLGSPLQVGYGVSYVDETGEEHIFNWNGSAYESPQGMIATLVYSGSNWLLTEKDRTVLTFDSVGALLSETDRNGNATTYVRAYQYLGGPWRILKTLTITAANGQSIVVNFSTVSGEEMATSASYATSAGTRTVTYSTASPWTVNYLSGSLSHSVTYTYASGLTRITATSFSGLAGSAQENFVYTNSKLTEARLPDYSSSVPDYNSSNTDARVTFATNGRSCTVTRYGAVRTSAAHTGATGTAISQVFTWNGHGSVDGRTNPKSSGGDQTWSYSYTTPTGWLTSETSPLGKTRSWTYDSRGDMLTATDELGHVTSLTYPTSGSDPNRDLPVTVTSPSGAVTTYTYDAYGNVTHVERQLNQNATGNLAETNYTYADATVGGSTFHQALTEVQKLSSGSTWVTTDLNTGGYYANGGPAQIVYRGVALQSGGTPVDLTQTMTYDAFGQLLTKTDTTGQVVETDVYDLAGNVTQKTSASFTATVSGSGVSTQVVQHNTYDRWGHLTETYLTSSGDTTGEKDNWQVLAYDASGRVSTATTRLWTVCPRAKCRVW